MAKILVEKGRASIMLALLVCMIFGMCDGLCLCFIMSQGYLHLALLLAMRCIAISHAPPDDFARTDPSLVRMIGSSILRFSISLILFMIVKFFYHYFVV